MRESRNLLEGDILSSLTKMALPLMGIAFIQMTYSFVDLIWIGRLSTDAVAAVGSAGFFIWVANAVAIIIKTGMSVELAQAYGRGDIKDVKDISVGGVHLAILLCLILTSIYLIFKNQIYGFFNLEASVFDLSIAYHEIISVGLVFTFANAFLTASFYSQGNSSTPFRTSIIALVFNIIMDPILIFGLGPIPAMGVRGAALATVLAQALSVLIYIIFGKLTGEVYTRVKYFDRLEMDKSLQILKLGFAPFMQSFIHALVSIKLNQYMAIYGAVGIATYTIGSQIEAISWMSAEGFSNAYTAFFGQNYGARQFDRLERGKKVCFTLTAVIGLIATAILVLGSSSLFKIFTPDDPRVLAEGQIYLIILGSTSVLMAMEIGTTGMMNGLGLTKYPALISTVFNVARIPMAYFLMTVLALRGIWVSMTISQALKGIIMLISFAYFNKKTNGFRENMDKYTNKLKKRKAA